MTNSETLSPDDPFYSSKFGIEWADYHFDELIREADAFMPNSYATVSEMDSEGAYKLIKFRLTKPMPISLTGHVLDIVYNLRAALDQAIYAVANLNNTLKGTPYFPIRNSVAEFEVAMKGLARNLPKEIADLIRTFQPYKGGNNLIWALNRLCNTHKHGIIQPFPIGATSGKLSGTGKGGGVQVPLHPEWDSGKNEMILIRIPVNGDHTVDFDFTFNIVFGEIEFVHRKEISSVLNKFFDIVKGIIVAIESETRRIGLI